MWCEDPILNPSATEEIIMFVVVFFACVVVPGISLYLRDRNKKQEDN